MHPKTIGCVAVTGCSSAAALRMAASTSCGVHQGLTAWFCGPFSFLIALYDALRMWPLSTAQLRNIFSTPIKLFTVLAARVLAIVARASRSRPSVMSSSKQSRPSVSSQCFKNDSAPEK
jgi:hypothetical protein